MGIKSRHHPYILCQGRRPVGHTSPAVRSDPAGIKTYFMVAFQALPKATVKFGD
jgi:hypothetical protein